MATGSQFTLPVGMNPFKTGATGFMHRVPDIIEFCLSDRYLNRPLYPRQATILKTVFLQDDQFTQYDLDVLYEWTQGFHPADVYSEGGIMRYEGLHGCPPDILDRIKIHKATGAKWFRENIIAIGRRGGKGYLGGIAGAYVLFNYLSLANPQMTYGVDRDKQMACQVFGAKKQTARDLQWKDLKDIISGAPCFTPFMGRILADSLTMKCAQEAVRERARLVRGITSTTEDYSFLIEPKEATLTAARGPASFMQFYDEMAHVSRSAGASANAAEVYSTAKPSLAQFGVDAFMWEGSSTWQMIGQFYENYLQSLEYNPETKQPMYPDMCMFILESWDPYVDWDVSHTIRTKAKERYIDLDKGDTAPRDPFYFPPMKRAMITYEDVAKEERANPESFAIEYRSHWAASLSAYLNAERVKAMWLPWNGKEIVPQARGMLTNNYVAHCDPSKSGANFGYAIAHTEVDDNGLTHVVFDQLKHWEPGDFPHNDYQMDYIEIQKWLEENCIDAFMPSELSFDQFNSIQIIQQLRRYVGSKQRPKNTHIYERTATKAVNWKIAETFKYALGFGLLHAPYNKQAENEMIFLQDVGHERVDHQTEGAVQTKDLWDAMANVVYGLVGQQIASMIGQDFEAFGISGGWDRNITPFANQMDPEQTDIARQFNDFQASTRGPGAYNPARSTAPRGVGRRVPHV